MARRIFVTGASGFVGRALVRVLVERGEKVSTVSRNPDAARAVLGDGVGVVAGDPGFAGAWQEQVAAADVVINLAGQAIAGQRWNARYRQIIHDSRVDTTRYLVEAMAAPEARPQLLISASGIDYYPFSVDLGAALAVDEDDEVGERAPRGESVLARICRDWEAEARRARSLGVRVVLMRMGVVLGRDGGALAQMSRPFKFLLGGRVGNGRQWFSWVHVDDVTRAFLFAIDDSGLSGAVNLVAPQPLRNRDLARALGRALHRPALLPAPAFAVRAAVGEFSEYLLNGRRAIPEVLLARDFEFAHPDIDGALAEIYCC